MLSSSVLLVGLLSALMAHAYEIGAIVNTTSGPVKGHASSIRPAVSEYLGIPYAQPPIGNLRFAPAEPVNASSSLFLADTYVCPRITPVLVSRYE